MSGQEREICGRIRRDWKHEAEVERVGMVVVIDPADGSLNRDSERLRSLDILGMQLSRNPLCEVYTIFLVSAGSLFAFGI